MGTIEQILLCDKFAGVGSFKDKSKYAYRILLYLLSKGKTIYPVNLRGDEIEGLKCYKSILEIEDTIDAISIITQPGVTEIIVKQCSDNGISNI